jgi:limonene 1,2-monooxygenase
MLERGGAIVGTPADAIEAVEKIIELSGGFGGVLGLAHEWAGSQERIFRSYELWARHVAPHFQGALTPVRASQDWVAGHKGDIFGPPGAAVRKAFEDGGVALPAGMEEQLQRGRT